MIVAIDGPAGAGKSTVALRVADALGFVLVGTGALYRAVACIALERGVDWEDGPALAPIAASLDVRFEVIDGVNRVYVGGDDWTERLRTADASRGASIVSAHAEVRDALVALQRDLGERFDVVMEGRDIGTVIFPDADVKVYLTASSEERARRRMADYERAGEAAEFAAVLEEIEARDARDRNRPVAPLRVAEGAVVVDASSQTVDAVVETIVGLARG